MRVSFTRWKKKLLLLATLTLGASQAAAEPACMEEAEPFSFISADHYVVHVKQCGSIQAIDRALGQFLQTKIQTWGYRFGMTEARIEDALTLMASTQSAGGWPIPEEKLAEIQAYHDDFVSRHGESRIFGGIYDGYHQDSPTAYDYFIFAQPADDWKWLIVPKVIGFGPHPQWPIEH